MSPSFHFLVRRAARCAPEWGGCQAPPSAHNLVNSVALFLALTLSSSVPLPCVSSSDPRTQAGRPIYASVWVAAAAVNSPDAGDRRRGTALPAATLPAVHLAALPALHLATLPALHLAGAALQPLREDVEAVFSAVRDEARGRYWEGGLQGGGVVREGAGAGEVGEVVCIVLEG